MPNPQSDESEFDSSGKQLANNSSEDNFNIPRSVIHSPVEQQLSQRSSRITVLIANTDPEDSLKIEHEIPCIVKNNVVGYDLAMLVSITMDAYRLDPKCGIQVDYWSS